VNVPRAVMTGLFFFMSVIFCSAPPLSAQPPETEKLFDDGAEKFLNKDWEGAVEVLERVNKLSPGNAQALNLLTRAYVQWAVELKARGLLEEALDRNGRALSLSPDNVPAQKLNQEIMRTIQAKEKSAAEKDEQKAKEEARRQQESASRQRVVAEQKEWVDKLRKEREDREKELREDMDRIKKREELLREELLIARHEVKTVGVRWLIVYVVTVIALIISAALISSKIVSRIRMGVEGRVTQESEKLGVLMDQQIRQIPLKKEFDSIAAHQEEILRAVKTKPVIPPQEEALIGQIDNLIELMKQMHKPSKADKITLSQPMERSMVTDISLENRQRAKSVEALERTIKDPAMAIRILSPYLKDTDNRVRAAACKAVYRFDSEGALGTLREMASSENRWMRLSAAWAAGELAIPEVCALIESLISDADLGVRKRAVQSALKAHAVLKERMPATLRMKIKEYEQGRQV